MDYFAACSFVAVLNQADQFGWYGPPDFFLGGLIIVLSSVCCCHDLIFLQLEFQSDNQKVATPLLTLTSSIGLLNLFPMWEKPDI